MHGASLSELGKCGGQNDAIEFPNAHQGLSSKKLSASGVCERYPTAKPDVINRPPAPINLCDTYAMQVRYGKVLCARNWE